MTNEDIEALQKTIDDTFSKVAELQGAVKKHWPDIQELHERCVQDEDSLSDEEYHILSECTMIGENLRDWAKDFPEVS